MPTIHIRYSLPERAFCIK